MRQIRDIGALAVLGLTISGCAPGSEKSPDQNASDGDRGLEERASRVNSIATKFGADTSWQARLLDLSIESPLAIQVQDLLPPVGAPPVVLVTQLVEAARLDTAIRVWLSLGLSADIDLQLDCPSSLRDSLRSRNGTYAVVAELKAVHPQLVTTPSVWIYNSDRDVGGEATLAGRPLLLGRCLVLALLPDLPGD